MLNKISIDNINGLFSTAKNDMPKISSPGHRPTYTSLQNFQTILNRNARNVPSHQSHQLGHLGLVIKTEDYKTLNNNTEWTDPTAPATKPRKPNTPAGETTDPFAAQDAIRAWHEERNTWTTFQLTQEALRNMIITNVDDQYIHKLKNELTEYATVTPLQLMTHLWDQYGEIDESDRTENEMRMKTPWMPPSPIEDLFKQLRDGQKFAEKGGETISNDLLIRYGLEVIGMTGLFTKECTKWCKHSRADKTWDKFQAYFTEKVQDYTKNSTASTATYTAAQVEEIIQHYQNDNNQNTVQQLDTQPAANAITAADITALVTEAINAATKNTTAGTQNGNNNNKKKPLLCQGYNDKNEPVTYCWTHGVTKNLRHTSSTCSRKAEGHKDNATLNNRMGGSDKTCEKRK